MTPVPGAAGLSMTRPAPMIPVVGWVMVEPASGTAVSAVAWVVKPLYTFEATPLPELIDFQGARATVCG